MCFVWIWEQTAIISLYNINWLVFVSQTECVYCAVRIESLYPTLWSPVVTLNTISLTFSNSMFNPHSVFICFVWIWEQTAIISLYNINWLVFVIETEIVYCAVRTGYIYIYIHTMPVNFLLWNAHGGYVESGIWALQCVSVDRVAPSLSYWRLSYYIRLLCLCKVLVSKQPQRNEGDINDWFYCLLTC